MGEGYILNTSDLPHWRIPVPDRNTGLKSPAVSSSERHPGEIEYIMTVGRILNDAQGIPGDLPFLQKWFGPPILVIFLVYFVEYGYPHIF